MGTFYAVVSSEHLLRFPHYHYAVSILVGVLRPAATYNILELRHHIGLGGTGFTVR